MNLRKKSEFEVYLWKRFQIQIRFATKIMNSKWIRDKESELKVNSRKLYWIRYEFEKKIVNEKWIRENYIEFVMNPRKRKWMRSEFAKKIGISKWNWIHYLCREFTLNFLSSSLSHFSFTICCVNSLRIH